ncbi:hypothetical protein FDZ71_15260, partial [bacterium]
EFIKVHERTFQKGLDLLVYPEGTRSKTLLRGRPGIGQLALYFRKYPIIPVGCNGSDKLYPGASLWAKKERVVYRFGTPITWEELKPFWIEEDFAPFTPEAEMKYMERFQGVADLVMARIAQLLDPEYLPRTGLDASPADAGRFI